MASALAVRGRPILFSRRPSVRGIRTSSRKFGRNENEASGSSSVAGIGVADSRLGGRHHTYEPTWHDLYFDSGITSKGSQLTSFNGIQAPPGHSLGSVSYSTGALISGSIAAGGIFSSAGSTFDVVGKGNYGEPKGPIFTGGFTGDIAWTLVSHTGSKLRLTR